MDLNIDHIKEAIEILQKYYGEDRYLWLKIQTESTSFPMSEEDIKRLHHLGWGRDGGTVPTPYDGWSNDFG